MSPPSQPLLRRLLSGTRWTYATVLVGLLFGVIQVIHTVGMLRFGPAGAVLEGVVPLVFGLGVAASGPWLQYRGYTQPEQKRIVGWMALVGIVAGLLFLWALSHQVIVAGETPTASDAGSGYSAGYGSTSGSGASSGAGATDGGFGQYASGGVFPHAKFVTATNLSAGALLGLLLGVYNVRSRRHYRVAQAEREQVAQQRARLSVLNRVLRHNLRNDANVILMHLRQITAQATGQLVDSAERAADKTTDLVALGEKARQIDATIGDDIAYTDEVQLRTAVERTLDRVPSEGTAVEPSVHIPDSVSLTTDVDLLTQVLGEVVENAVQHAESDSVRVRITADLDTDGWVELLVEDDGPGIPDHEQVGLEADEETALEHASGLGLWLVRWGVTALGGDVTCEESEWGGTTVRLRLPVTPNGTTVTGSRGGSTLERRTAPVEELTYS